jgi:hypothetical protein
VNRSVTESSTPGFIAMCALLILVLAGKSVFYGNIDPDFFWHVRVAEQIERQGVGPLVDTLSFSSVREPWTPYSWLGQLWMKWTLDVGGLRGVVLLQAFLEASILIFVALACREVCRRVHAGPRHVATASAVLASAIFCFPYLSFRPVLFALAIMSAIVWLIHRDRRLGRSRAVWLVVPMTAVVVNLHLYAAVVIMWTAAVAIGRWIDRGEDKIRWTLLACFTGLASLCTPLLPGVIAQAMAYQQADVMVREGQIAEMMPFYGGVGGAVMACVVALTVGLAIRNRRKIGWADLLMLGVGLVLIFKLGRFAPVFAMSSMPILAATLPRMNDMILARPALKFALCAMALVGVVRWAGSVPSGRVTIDEWVVRLGPDVGGFPADATRYVSEQVTPTTGRVINEFTWGGYIGWRLGDRFQVFVDGRTQLFSEAFWRSTYLGDEAKRTDFLRSTPADAAILPRQKSRFRSSLESLGWRVVHEDEFAVVLAPGTTAALDPD